VAFGSPAPAILRGVTCTAKASCERTKGLLGDSDRGAGIGRFRYSHSVEALKGRVLVLVGGESGPPQTPLSFDERVGRRLLARP
jgi:hypothetical protein